MSSLTLSTYCTHTHSLSPVLGLPTVESRLDEIGNVELFWSLLNFENVTERRSMSSASILPLFRRSSSLFLFICVCDSYLVTGTSTFLGWTVRVNLVVESTGSADISSSLICLRICDDCSRTLETVEITSPAVDDFIVLS